jgi:hypothetical protein
VCVRDRLRVLIATDFGLTKVLSQLSSQQTSAHLPFFSGPKRDTNNKLDTQLWWCAVVEGNVPIQKKKQMVGKVIDNNIVSRTRRETCEAIWDGEKNCIERG